MCVCLAYHTLGVHYRLLLHLLLWINVIPTKLLVSDKKKPRRSGLAIAAVIGLPVVPYQVYLALQWLGIRAEVERVVRWAEERRDDHGTYPTDLSEYRYSRRRTAAHIQYRTPLQGLYVSYHVGNRNCEHWYIGNGIWKCDGD